MFSLQIVDTDAFLEMPMSSQLLYFHFAMRADDEGFVGNPKKIIKMVGSNEDDFKVLIAKRFLLAFESGIVVIKHWLIHNSIRLDRFNPTSHQKEKAQIKTAENKAYTEVDTTRQPSGNQSLPQVKLIEGNISEVNSTFAKAKGRKRPSVKNPIIQSLWDFGRNLGFSTVNEKMNRYALNRLLKKKNSEQLKKAAEFSQEIREQPYAPQVNNWIDLEQKYLKLRDFVQRRNRQVQETKGKTVIL